MIYNWDFGKNHSAKMTKFDYKILKKMKSVKAYAALSAEKALEPWQIDRREPGPEDVEIENKESCIMLY